MRAPCRKITCAVRLLWSICNIHISAIARVDTSRSIACYAIGASSSEMRLLAHSTESCEEPRTQLVLSCLTKANIASHSLDIAMTIVPLKQ